MPPHWKTSLIELRTRSSRQLFLGAAFTIIFATLIPTPAFGTERPFCWIVRSKTATVFLLGSIHVARPDIYPLPGSLEKAFKSSKTLVVEVDPRESEADATSLLELTTYPPGDSLDRHIPKGLLKQTLSRFPFPPEQAVRLRPWMVALTLTMTELGKLGITPANGVDLHFLNKSGDRQILELESVQSQLEMLAKFDEKQQALFLEYTLRDLENLGENIDKMLRIWKSGDAQALERLIFEGRRAEPALEPVYRKLFDDRNVEMAKTIGKLLNGRDTIFVVVGAGHLVGQAGLLEILRSDFSVKPLKNL